MREQDRKERNRRGRLEVWIRGKRERKAGKEMRLKELQEKKNTKVEGEKKIDMKKFGNRW